MYLETPRLVLREFRADDFDALLEMDSRPESMRYEPQKGADGVRAYLESAAMAAFFEPRTHYRFAITIRPEDTARGLIGLAMNSDMTRDWEIGWMVHPDEWGKGYASEAARREAHMLQTRLLHGKWRDELLYAILESEWPAARA